MRVLFCVFLLLSSGTAIAQSYKSAKPAKQSGPKAVPKSGGLIWEFEGAFELPIQVGAKIKGRTAKQIYGVFGLGFGPEFLMSALGSFAGNTGGIGKQMGLVIGDSLVNSFVVDARIGWAIQGFEGLYVEVGYLMMSSAGGKTDTRNLEEAIGYLPLLSDSTKTTVDATIHAVTLHAGYSIVAADDFIISLEGGIMKPVAVASNVKINDPFDAILSESRRRDAQAAYDKAVTGKMFIPTIGLRAMYLF